MRRVVIVGSGGSGKTTLADELARRTGLPVIHLDEHFWHPGWLETPRDVWRATLDERLPRADTVILCDFPTWRTLPRVLRRTMGNRGRAVQADGCPERLDPKFLWWVLRYRYRSRPRVIRAIAELAPEADVHVLRKPRDVEEFLAESKST
jgi:adenylate kinase family enzyme